tara:strand:+ start:12448 stop:13347 length:900 start_codon:yes stop_codon:yes gene_type:complete
LKSLKYYIAVLSALFVSTPVLSQAIHSVEWEGGVNIRVVKEWSDSLNKVSDVGSVTYIRKKSGGKDSLHRVGHRDVIIWVPGTTDLSKAFTVVIWFHGHYGYVPHRTFENRTLKQFVPLAADKNFVVIIPEMPWSVHTKTPVKRNSKLWMKPGQFISFVKQVELELIQHWMMQTKTVPISDLRIGKIDYRIVGHSAGGSTIKRLAMTGDLCKLEPSKIVWSDSSYGEWLDHAWGGCLKNTKIPVEVFVVRGDSPWRNAKRFMAKFKTPPSNVHVHVMKRPRWSHKLIGNNIVNLSGLLD